MTNWGAYRRSPGTQQIRRYRRRSVPLRTIPRIRLHRGPERGVTYDENGNLQSDGTNTYAWDLRNDLSAISGGTTSSFQYDGVGRRINKTINGTSTSFLYDHWNVVQELSGSTRTANVIDGLRLDQIFARTDSAGVRFFLADALGSTLGLVASNGSVSTSYIYEPFGHPSVTGSTSTNAYQFTGRENDGTGLYFYRARYYKPGFGRFAIEDPSGFAGGANLFAYVADNPINFADPLGLKPQPMCDPTISPMLCVGIHSPSLVRPLSLRICMNLSLLLTVSPAWP